MAYAILQCILEKNRTLVVVEPEPDRTLVVTQPEPCCQILDNNPNRTELW